MQIIRSRGRALFVAHERVIARKFLGIVKANANERGQLIVQTARRSNPANLCVARSRQYQINFA